MTEETLDVSVCEIMTIMFAASKGEKPGSTKYNFMSIWLTQVKSVHKYTDRKQQAKSSFKKLNTFSVFQVFFFQKPLSF